MEKGKRISFGKILFIMISVLVIGGGVLLVNYRNNDAAEARKEKQAQKEADKDDTKKKNDDKVYESFSYTRKDLCNGGDECEKTFTYDGKEYKLVMKKADSSIDSDEMDSMSFNSVTLNGIDVADGVMDHLEKINFTRKGYIAIELSDSLTGRDNALLFYDTDLEIVASYNSIRSFNYDGSESGKFYRCVISGNDDILKEYDFKYEDGKFTSKLVSEKKDNCFS